MICSLCTLTIIGSNDHKSLWIIFCLISSCLQRIFTMKINDFFFSKCFLRVGMESEWELLMWWWKKIILGRRFVVRFIFVCLQVFLCNFFSPLRCCSWIRNKSCVYFFAILGSKILGYGNKEDFFMVVLRERKKANLFLREEEKMLKAFLIDYFSHLIIFLKKIQ